MTSPGIVPETHALAGAIMSLHTGCFQTGHRTGPGTLQAGGMRSCPWRPQATEFRRVAGCA